MTGNFFRIFFRNLLGHKIIAAINVSGLTLGLCAFLMLMLYVDHEYSWERQWPHSDRLVRVIGTMIQEGQNFPFGVPAVSKEQLDDYFKGEIELSTQLAFVPSQAVEVDGEPVELFPTLVDGNFLELFDLEVLEGNLQSVLDSPLRLALLDETATKIFGTTKAVGKSITITNADNIPREYLVTAVFRKPGDNTSLRISAFTLLDPAVQNGLTEQLNSWAYPYLSSTQYYRVAEGVEPERLNARMDEFTDQYASAFTYLGKDKKPSEGLRIRFQNLTEVHFNPRFGETGTDVLKVNIFAAIAILILLIGTINYLTLATAQSAGRRREIGVKKTAGASARELMLQFIGESLVCTVLAMLMALVLAHQLLPVFSNLIGPQLQLDFSRRELGAFVVMVTSVVGILGGFYPGLVLSRFRPQEVLRAGEAKVFAQSLNLRSVLMGFQFSIAIALILATIVLYLQLKLVHERDPGFRANNVAAVAGFNNGPGQEQIPALKSEICRLEGVQECTLAGRWVSSLNGVYPHYNYYRAQSDENPVGMDGVSIGYNFVELYQIPLLAGRSFDEARDILDKESGRFIDAENPDNPRSRIVLNQTASRELGFDTPQAAVGQSVFQKVKNEDGEVIYRAQDIIGVIADNQWLSLRERPVALTYVLGIEKYAWFIQARLTPGYEAIFQSEVQRIWQEVLGSGVPRIEFAETNMASAFKQEENEGRLLIGFAALAILISCLGLYGIVLFELRRRTKEIGIRKALGSEVKSIVALFAWQFSKPVLLANILAWPLAVWALQQWLQRFPYQVDAILLLPACVLAGLLAWLIAVVTVSVTSIRAADAPPVQSLRYE